MADSSTPTPGPSLREDEELARRLQAEEDGAGSRPPSASSGRTWSGWFQEVQSQGIDMAKQVHSQAGDMAKQAQEAAALHAEKMAKAASEAKQAAIEKADALAKQAQEFRQNYDMQLATSVLMTSMGASSASSASSSTASTPSSGRKIRGGIAPAQLDLEYVTENVIAMAFPYDPKRPGNAQGGNDINAVSAFLRKRHQGHFMVWNISEEPYDTSLFADQVLEYKFPGHPAPPLGLLFKICTSVESWLDADEENVAVVHCLTGKGRTAALVACILTWIGEFSSPMEALQYVAERKGISVDYLTIPSQRRYVQYFSNMLDGVKPRSEPLLLRRVIINSIPIFGDNAGGPDNLGCCPYLQLFKGGKLIATATPPDGDTYAGGGHTTAQAAADKKKLQLKWIKASEGSVSFAVDCAVQGDILLRCRHAESSGTRLSMFRAAFHTGYAPSGVLRLTKAQLDGSVSDSRFHDDFFIDLIFAPIEKSESSASSSSSGDSSNANGNNVPPNAISIVGEPSDSGLVIDASSADRYELTLHRDTRFWEAVSARKSKSKKRTSRKFVSSTQDQFSISDDSSGHGRQETPKPAPAARPPSKAVGNMSDLELIMQLARAEEDTMGDMDGDISTPTLNLQPMGKLASSHSNNNSANFSNSPSSASSVTAANLELQALEDLEKELGLDDLQLFTNTQFGDSGSSLETDAFSASSGGDAGAAGVKTTATLSGESEEDNLDELEKYLSSLSK